MFSVRQFQSSRARESARCPSRFAQCKARTRFNPRALVRARAAGAVPHVFPNNVEFQSSRARESARCDDK